MNDSKVRNAMEFYLMATQLKYKIRSGWDMMHWGITRDRIESVAEHIYGTQILAISLNSEFDFDIDLGKVLKMLALHEIGETIIGDITPFDNVTPEEKQRIEHEAIFSLTKFMRQKDEINNLLLEFDERKTNEAKFAYMCDKLEADLQSKIYQDTGYHKSLDDQEDNKILKTEKARHYIEGAKDPFDVWYAFDYHHFEDNIYFKSMLMFAKNNSLDVSEKLDKLIKENNK